MYSDDTSVDLQLVESDQSKGWRGRHVRPRRPFPWTVLLVTGALILVFVGASALWIGYSEVYGHQGQTKDNQNALENQWDNDPVISVPSSTPTPKPPKKKPVDEPPAPPPLAKLYIPNLDKTWYVVDGVDADSLRYAPGHYPSSALPGKVGNFAVAGHREPGMFWDLDRVTVGKTIVVETHTMRYTYVVKANFVVKPNASYVVAPVPPGFNRGDKLLTLTTCSKLDAKTRLIVQAELTETVKL